MRRALLTHIICLGSALGATAPVAAGDDFTADFLQRVEQAREAALQDQTAWHLVESLTTEVGPRKAGSPGDAKAVAWGERQFKALAFDRVYLEPVELTPWQREHESGEILAPYPQPLVLTALGGSPATPKRGLTGELVHVPSYEALLETPAEQLRDKIVFISQRMDREKDGSGYGRANKARYLGPEVAAQKGARGYLMRSLGTEDDRTAHTGGMKVSEEVDPIPAAALANPDADQIERMLARGATVQVRLRIEAQWRKTYTSHNVIGEITGRERPEEVVLIGCHLDSWDLGTGAIDDASGCGITMAAAKLVRDHIGQPARTIRVVLWANEEHGLSGAKAYHEAHKDALDKHIIGAESDFGAGPVYALASRVKAEAVPVMQQIAALMQPLGIEYKDNTGYSGADISPLRTAGMATAGLYQDGTVYFDYHHTVNDTLDKIVPEELAQNVAAWVVFTAMAAEHSGDFGWGLKD